MHRRPSSQLANTKHAPAPAPPHRCTRCRPCSLACRPGRPRSSRRQSPPCGCCPTPVRRPSSCDSAEQHGMDSIRSSCMMDAPTSTQRKLVTGCGVQQGPAPSRSISPPPASTQLSPHSVFFFMLHFARSTAGCGLLPAAAPPAAVPPPPAPPPAAPSRCCCCSCCLSTMGCFCCCAPAPPAAPPVTPPLNAAATGGRSGVWVQAYHTGTASVQPCLALPGGPLTVMLFLHTTTSAF